MMREKSEIENHVVILEASKASIEHNADRILERENITIGRYDRLRAEFTEQRRQLLEKEEEINALIRRFDYQKSENQILFRENASLKDAMKASQDKHRTEVTRKRRKV